MGVGAVHSVFGLVFLGDTLAILWNEGLFNTVNGQPEREFAFWFVFFGLLTILLGAVVDWTEVSKAGLPQVFGWALLGLTLICVTVMPISGGWLLLPPALGAIRRSRERGAPGGG